MYDRIAQERIARLEASVVAEPGAPEFPALAETLRRAGRLQAAEDVARRGLEHKPGCLEGLVALALVLLDQGRESEARRELSTRAEEFLGTGGEADPLAPQPETDANFGEDVSDGEIEAAFDDAEPLRDQMVDADQVAHEAIRVGELGVPEGLSEASDPLFQTHTMADLLERQGDAAGASQIRAAITPADAESNAPADDDRARRDQIVATLEGWLERLRRQPR